MSRGAPEPGAGPQASTPPNGAFASSLTVWSLMCTIPLGISSATARPCITSRVTMPSDRPYSLSAASRAASSTDPTRVTGATGPDTSSVNAGAVRGTSDSTVGR